MSDRLVCCHCGEASIASLDHYTATCDGAVTVDADGELAFEPGGWTEIHWDTCRQVGWQCRSCFAQELAEPGLDAALARLVRRPGDG